MMIRFSTSTSIAWYIEYPTIKKESTTNAERDNVTKIMNELRKYTDFLKDTKWMFENNPGLHIDNYSPNPLWFSIIHIVVSTLNK